MDTSEAIKTRKSCRKFLPTEIPRKEIEMVIIDAMSAPSYKNSQPWQVAVVSGNKKNELSKLLLDLLNQNVSIQPDIPEALQWPEINATRIKNTIAKRIQAYGIQPGDPDAPRKSRMANFQFYGAPVVLFFFQDASLGLWSILDMGMFIENIMLGFHARGMASVPQAFLTDYSSQVKQFLGIGDHNRLILGMSAGLPDLNDPKATFSPARVSLEEIVCWME
ncbi:MAG: nitroreductase [Spirochaetia bacterium]|nr:nitroreductase [Spirochaetia bacterium]